jgi:cytochrome c-type biogenesis protein CcmF
LGVFVLGAVVETGYRVEAARPLAVGQSLQAGKWTVTLDDVRIVEGPNYLAEQGHLIVSVPGGRSRTVTAERRFFPTGGQTTTEVGLDFRGLDDVYVVLGERAQSPDGARAWNVRVWWNPWARLIFLGPLIMALGGVLSLLDRRLRLAVGARKAA